MDYQEEFKKTQLSQPHCILGKNGITTEFISHVSRLLKRFRIIKVKALKNVATKSNIKDTAVEISKITNSYLVDVRGRTFILSLKKI
ncbi:MAG: YhbY family RNA-binding protein [Promethearchaeota archaeon]|jgi:RNA-binding protein YhbY